MRTVKIEDAQRLEKQNKFLTKLGKENLERISDVEVNLFAEFGVTEVPLKSILEYDTGTIIQLDRKSCDPINIYVDNVLIAKGEIVAVDNNFGVKITEIVEHA